MKPRHECVTSASANAGNKSRSRAESAAREARRQAEAVAHQRAAEAEAQHAALDAWAEAQCERARTALRNGQFGEARQLAQAVLARAPDAAEAVRILDEAIAGQAESEASAARRREIARTLAQAAAALEAGDAATARMQVEAPIGILGNGETAVIEMASASGLWLLRPDQRDPTRTTTYGTGELLRAAAELGVKRVILGIGGSATVDGGAGCAQAWGASFRMISGQTYSVGDRRLTGGDLSRHLRASPSL